jgi:hypothetical protein
VAAFALSPRRPSSVAALTCSRTSSILATGTKISHFPLLSVASGYCPVFLSAQTQ